VDGAPRPVLAGFGVRPAVPGTDGAVPVPQRRDVVFLLAAGPTPATAVPRHPGAVSQATETGYVYYTAIPRFCAVTTSAGNLVLPTSSGGLWTPGSVVRGPVVPGSEAASTKTSGLVRDAKSVVPSTAPSWSPTALIGDPSTTRVGTSRVGASLVGAFRVGTSQVGASRVAVTTNGCSGSVVGSCTIKPETETITMVASLDPAVPKSASPGAHDPTSTDGVEVITSSTTSRTFTCSECNRDFGSEKYLNMHMSLHLQSSALVPSRGGNEAAVSPTLAGAIPDHSSISTYGTYFTHLCSSDTY